ncbi:MAG: hypothetical protein A2758_02725 [Candidatus Zambryskibacteria bacterium RIFCSPHIGHO2_01_FULL_49_18]|uniref:Glutamate--tRNA ligase n=2 Tax=Candidatus Zambryskiibacteriota TaxID=1817925 RepID=A0A1G2T2V9_9BACT|nr:MAG: hypothetical protein A2758_02725 [Candidatus Zambryskibacteria bacterium RIFCSPHIGHO2_01_FULL_49_18]OHB04989.1 MAG: hypothetical protein A3A26_00220 [Candidatus Zambryskibacteria bacterium RIFCSPLOWO2_01_FULL_47_14]
MQQKTNEKVTVRIPPSPTGNLHIGTARTALFNYLFAKKHGGKILLRIEDTDRERSKKEFEENIIEALDWLGIKHDGEVARQSERTDVYEKYIRKMLENNSAYESDDGVIRFRNPNAKVKFADEVRGEIEFDTSDLEDFVIAKSLREPLYHLAVVVDDFESGVTHVIRGEDHISNTPRQILIQEVIGASRPVYAHIPLILAPDRSKLSKRHGATAVTQYRDMGILSEALINYLALLGWNPGTDQEIFTMEELIEQFDLKKIQKGGAIFDQKKLDWVNKEHIKRLLPEKQRELLLKSIENESYMTSEPELDAGKIVWKKSSKEDAMRHLGEVSEIMQKGSKGDMGDVKEKIMEYAEREGKGNVLWPMRYALTGSEASPDPFTILEFLGIEKSLKRIEKAIIILKNDKSEVRNSKSETN